MGQNMGAAGLNFETIHAEYRPKIQRYLARLVGPQDAEDLTQEVLIKISRGLATFRGESQLSTWIYRIAANTALDRLRDPSFRPGEALGLSDGSAGSEGQVADIEVKGPSVEQQVCRQERFECYRGFIQDLPPHYRAVVALSELEQLAAAEIADLLGLSLDVVKIRLHRGRERLLRELKSHCRPEDWL